MLPFTANAQLENLSNMSAKWIRANARNAALEGADIVNYNPAGVARFTDGIFVSINNQSLFRKPQHSFTLNAALGNQSYKQDGADFLLPALYAAFKHEKWGLSSGIYIAGGGGTADYPNGSVNTNLLGYSRITMINTLTNGFYQSIKDQYLKASSYSIAIPLSFAYAINDKLSLSLGGRYLMGNSKTEAGLTYTNSAIGRTDYQITADYRKEASGFGGIIGVNYTVNDKLNFSAHYETKVKMEYEVKDNKGSMALEADGTKSRRDMPAVLYTGAAVKLTDKLRTAVDFNYYFQKGADWGTFASTTDKVADAAGNCYHVALGAYFQLMPKLEVSAGFKYIHFDFTNQELYYTNMGVYETVKYDNYNLGVGAGYRLTEKILIDLAYGYTMWPDKTVKRESSNGLAVDMSNSSHVLALGVDLKF
jgi:long-chain fatty acid transport protein